MSLHSVGALISLVISVSNPVFIDGHVHLHDFVSIHDFLSSACRNIRQSANISDSESLMAFLCLADFQGSEGWARLTGKDSQLEEHAWRLNRIGELIISAEAENGDHLWIVAGRQIVTSESLEVMAVAVAEPIRDGSPFRHTITEIKKRAGLAVVPWGAGKWWGRRGRIIAETMKMANGVLYGDNGGRPWFWKPQLLKLATTHNLPVIPGSDPLPIKSDCLRNGVYGIRSRGPVEEHTSVDWLLEEMRGVGDDVVRFGKTSSGRAFFSKQLQLVLNKRG